MGYSGEKLITEPPQNDELAEFIGILLGDGCSYKCERRSRWQITIAGNSDEYEYFEQWIVPSSERLFGIKPKITTSKRRKSIWVVMQRNSLGRFLESSGFPPGNKTNREAKIPDWIMQNNNYLRACLRGLIDTDGCVFKSNKYTQISFTNHSTPLLEQYREACLRLGFYASKVSNHKVYISRRTHVVNYLKEVGFRNPKHQRRCCEFISAP